MLKATENFIVSYRNIFEKISKYKNWDKDGFFKKIDGARDLLFLSVNQEQESRDMLDEFESELLNKIKEMEKNEEN